MRHGSANQQQCFSKLRLWQQSGYAKLLFIDLLLTSVDFIDLSVDLTLPAPPHPHIPPFFHQQAAAVAADGVHQAALLFKLRLWQQTEYTKLLFIDSDLLLLTSVDFLFSYPEISARGNAGTDFNSGVMVLEPSDCTFDLLMKNLKRVTSANGGDQVRP
ncbi:unnamed protein product [Closterium sp. Naga37s-1]|nr:unnamed protein product [Closterium sp. Naga37s-1]